MMKVAQVAPLIESVPPRFYGGTERIVSYLTEGLVGLDDRFHRGCHIGGIHLDFLTPIYAP